MEFHPLNSFVEVVRQGGFTKAARAVATSQSSISKAVRQLEQELGTQLLRRGGQRPVLTPAGELVFRRGAKLLADRDALLNELNEMRGLVRGSLKVGLSPALCDDLLARLLHAFAEAHPEITVSIVERQNDKLEAEIERGAIDIALMLKPGSSGPIHYHPLAWQRLFALLPAAADEAQRERLALIALREHSLILADHDAQVETLLRRACHRHNFDPQVRVRSQQPGFIRQLVEQKLGIALIPQAARMQLGALGEELECVPIDETDLILPFGLGHSATTPLPPAALALVKLAVERYAA